MSEYLIKCRENYYNGITPSNSESKTNSAYKQLREVAFDIIKREGVEFFSGYFQEGYYLVDLWTAHILIEHFEIEDEIEQQCLRIIKDYSDNPLNPSVSLEEQKWLEENVCHGLAQHKKN